VILLIAFGFLIYLAIKLQPLFRPGEVLFWALVAGALLVIIAFNFWPRRRSPAEWHEN
jgi:hypothetical protein